jgi:ATP-dependent DNA ligase
MPDNRAENDARKSLDARKLGLEGIVSKRKDSAYRSGRSPDWLKMKNPTAPAVKREEDEEWGKKKRR